MCCNIRRGPGFVLALFPAGFQVIPLYVLTSVVAVGFCAARVDLCVHAAIG